MTSGLQQIVLNHQGQQILVQRAAAPSQPQNIVLRTAGGQSSILQLPQQAASNTQQIHTAPQQIHTAPQQIHTAPQQIHTAPQQIQVHNVDLQFIDT